MRALEVEENYASVSASLRDAELQLTRELSESTLRDISSSVPPVVALALDISEEEEEELEEGEVPTSASVTFQLPRSLDGVVWSTPITISARNEDLDGDLLLDSDEDTDGNGVLDRVIERMEDLNDDGDFTDPGETRVLVRKVDFLTMQLNENLLSITVNCTELAQNGSETIIQSSLNFTIPITN
jgi:hypothetical protein